jgi:hypothetical protein
MRQPFPFRAKATAWVQTWNCFRFGKPPAFALSRVALPSREVKLVQGERIPPNTITPTLHKYSMA